MSTMQRRDLLTRAFAMAATGLFLPPRNIFAGHTRSAFFDVLLFGARGDGKTNDTRAIQQAIDSCAKQGGGIVSLNFARIYVSGTLVLKANVDLRIEEGSTLKASGDRNGFRTLGSLVFADHADNVAISGKGKIDGNFHAFLKDRVAGGYQVTWPFLGPFDPLYDKPGIDHIDGRPRMVLLVGCKGASLRDFTVVDSPTWTIHPIGCENLEISGITIRNDLEVPNCDGIDIDHCQNVRIESCDIQAGDDCIVLKTSRNFSEYGACENIAVANCILTSTSAGIKIEPEGSDPIRMAVFTGCTISNSNRGIAVLNRDGALIENLMFSDLLITTDLKPAMWWGAGEPVHISNVTRSLGLTKGVVRNLQFNNLICKGESGIYIHGWADCPIYGITFSNVDLTLKKISQQTGGFYDLRPGDVAGGIYQHTIAAIYCELAKNLAFRDVTVHWEGPLPTYYGPALEARHIQNLSLSNFRGHGAHPASDPDRIFDDVTVTD